MGEASGVEVIATHSAHGLRFHVAVGSVVDFTGDAIVNAANEGCISGGGVDGAITDAGGEQLHEARLALPIIDGTRAVRCATGDAVITPAFGRLGCRWVIHAVGPNYYSLDVENGDTQLRSAYAAALRIAAHQSGIRTVAFSLLSSGIFRGQRSLASVLQIGLSALRDCAACLPSSSELSDIYLVAFTSDEERELLEVARAEFESAMRTGPAAPRTALPTKPNVLGSSMENGSAQRAGELGDAATRPAVATRF